MGKVVGGTILFVLRLMILLGLLKGAVVISGSPAMGPEENLFTLVVCGLGTFFLFGELFTGKAE